MISRIRVIGLVGAGAITSAAICSLYLAYTLDESVGGLQFIESSSSIASSARTTPHLEAGFSPPSVQVNPVMTDPAPVDSAGGDQAFLVAFLADANPQVRTLAAWGMVSCEEARNGQQDVLEFIRHERDPQVRMALYRFLQGQHPIQSRTLIDLVRQEEDPETWIASCDLLAGVIESGADEETELFFNQTVVPKLVTSALSAAALHSRIAAIIALRRAGTSDAVDALWQISRASVDPQVVRAASSAARLSTLN